MVSRAEQIEDVRSGRVKIYKYTEQHHISYYPEIKIEIPRRVHQEIHNIVPMDTLLSRKMRQYDAVTRLIISMKNWSTAYNKDFGTHPDIGLDYAIELKKQLRKELDEMVKEERQKVKHIIGFGSRYLAGILAYAHPNRFSSLRKFLFYCGFTEASRKLKKYSRRIKPIIFQAVKNLIMAKEERYYPLYLKIKGDLRKRFPEHSKMAIHRMAMNRTGTFLLKEIYEIFHRQKELGGLSVESTHKDRGLNKSSTSNSCNHVGGL